MFPAPSWTASSTGTTVSSMVPSTQQEFTQWTVMESNVSEDFLSPCCVPVTALCKFFLSSQRLCAVGTVLPPISEMSYLRHRKGEGTAQGRMNEMTALGAGNHDN